MIKNEEIPIIFYGTAWKKERTAGLVELAIKCGFCAIDTACQPKHYFEPGVGEGIRRSGVDRAQLFLQTKFTPYRGQDPDNIPYDPTSCISSQVKKSLEVSLSNLKTNYLDSLILHSPMDTMEETLEVWEVFESFISEKKVFNLGLSNCYDIHFFKELYDKAKIKPRFLQNRFYAKTGYDQELRQFCLGSNVSYQSFWTLTANPHLLESSTLIELARKYKVAPPQILYRFLTQCKVIPLIGTSSEQHMKDDLEIINFSLSKDEVDALQSILL